VNCQLFGSTCAENSLDSLMLEEKNNRVSSSCTSIVLHRPLVAEKEAV